MDKDYFAHERALVDPGARIGPGTRIWANAHVLGGAVIGRDCNICDQTFVENDVVIGDRVTIKCGVQVWDGVRLSDDVFVGPNATFTNDPFPRSKQYPDRFAQTFVGRGASIGANATILPGVRVGTGAMVGAGAVVTRDVPAYAVVAGNPATVRRFAVDGVHRVGDPRLVDAVSGVRPVPTAADRGAGRAAGPSLPLPFAAGLATPVVLPGGGGAPWSGASRDSELLFWCAAGSTSLFVDDGRRRTVVELAAPGEAVLLSARVWATVFGASPEAVLLLLSPGRDLPPASSFGSYEEFAESVARG